MGLHLQGRRDGVTLGHHLIPATGEKKEGYCKATAPRESCDERKIRRLIGPRCYNQI